MSRMDDWKKTLDEGVDLAREGLAFVAEKAEDASRVAALRIKIFGLQRRIERHYAELGQIAYETADTHKDLWDNPAAKKISQEITSLQSRINDLFAQIQNVGRRTPKRDRAADTGGTGKSAPGAPSARRRKPTTK